MSSSQFHSAKLKLEQAQRHINELCSLLDHFNKGDFYKVKWGEDVQSGFYSVSLVVQESIPEHVALVIGDVIHNFRAALDHLAYEIVVATGGDGSRIYFPFGDDRDNLLDNKHYKTIETASKQIAGIIADTIKPYKTGNYTLWALNKIDIIDKHRLLIPVAQGTTGLRIDMLGEDGKPFCVMMHNIKDRLGYPNTAKLHKKPIEVTNFTKPTINILFEKGTFFDNQPVLETFKSIESQVEQVIDLFASAGVGKP